MQSHSVLEIFPRHVLERADLYDSGVVDQDVDLAEAIDGLLNRRLNLRCIKQIALNPESIRGAAAPGEVSFCAPEFLDIARNERDLSACRTNLASKHEPESPGSACDKNDFIAQGKALCSD
jgi:hypothetical protein